MKLFDLEAAKAGSPVYTRNGLKVRIICFDFNSWAGETKLVALVRHADGGECLSTYNLDGSSGINGDLGQTLMTLEPRVSLS
jgi:hypothetical protein